MPITFGRSCVRIIRNSRDVQPTHFLTGRPELGVGTSQGVLGLKEGLAMVTILLNLIHVSIIDHFRPKLLQ